MSLWAKFKNYFFGLPLPQPETPVVKSEAPVPAAPVATLTPESTKLELKIDEVKQEATLTVTPPPSVEVTPAEPAKKKAPVKKRSTKKKA